MRFTYSAPADALYIELVGGRREVARSQEVGSGITLDFDAGGRLLGIELLNATRHVPRDQLEAAGTPDEWLTLAEASAAAAEEGVVLSPATLRVQIRNGRIPAEKRGRDHFVSRHALFTYFESRAPSGRRGTPPAAATREAAEREIVKGIAARVDGQGARSTVMARLNRAESSAMMAAADDMARDVLAFRKRARPKRKGRPRPKR